MNVIPQDYYQESNASNEDAYYALIVRHILQYALLDSQHKLSYRKTISSGICNFASRTMLV